MKAFDVGGHRGLVHLFLVDPDFARFADGHQYAHCRLLFVRLRIGAEDVDTGLFDERRGNDEENQHDEHDIQHRRQVQVRLVIGSGVGSNLPHRIILSSSYIAQS